MNLLLHPRIAPREWALLWLSLVLFALSARAQSSPAGTVEGRISNPATGLYLENARVTVEGTSLEAFTDTSGYYRLPGVPAGTARVTAFRTGMEAQSETVTVTAGEVVHRDFRLSDAGAAASGDKVVKLDAFVVSTSQEMEGAAIAINEKRFADNSVNVVAADEFGPVADGGIGQVLKFVPGINLSRGGFDDAYQVTLNGAPPRNVPITLGGISFAEAASGLNRATGLQQSSVNNFSRAEVEYTATPETQGEALAGSINMVPLSAFERTKPVFTITTDLMGRSNMRSLEESPGPLNEPQRKVQLGTDFSAIVPVNNRFGFTFSGSLSALDSTAHQAQMTWVGTDAASNGTTLPATTPDQPYLTQYVFRNTPILSKRTTLGGTFDYRLGPDDMLSGMFIYGFSDAQKYSRGVNFNVGAVAAGNFSTGFTHGTAGKGTIQLLNSYTKLGGMMDTPSLTYRHNGKVWKIEAAAGISKSTRYDENLDDQSMFSAVTAQETNVTVNFDNIYYLQPGNITVLNGTTGAAVNPFQISNYSLTSATGAVLKIQDEKRTAYASAQRLFDGAVPFKIKVGVDFRDERVDTATLSPTYAFAGPNSNASQIYDPSFSQTASPFGWPSVQTMSNQSLYSLYRQNPTWFTENAATTYTSYVAASEYAGELVSSAYLRGDASFFSNRLKLVGGVRGEETDAKGQGQLVDPTKNYQRSASGTYLLGANGSPLLIAPAGSLAAVQLTNGLRGLHDSDRYGRLFPSLNATYEIREDLLFRAGYYWSIGRPALSQYASGLTLPDASQPASSGNVITVNNPGVKPWSAQTYKASLEYYFEKVGVLQITGYERHIDNLIASTTFIPSASFLAQYGLDPNTYGSYNAVTQYNQTKPVTMSGLELNYKQALTFLPYWARGFQAWGNVTAEHLTGDDTGSFFGGAGANVGGYVSRIYNGGLSFTRGPVDLRMSWNYAGKGRQALAAAGASIAPNTYQFESKRMITELSASYTLTKNLSLFMNLSNLDDAPIDLKVYGPSTPAVANFRTRTAFYSQETVGLKGTF